MTPNVIVSGIMVKFPTRDTPKQAGNNNQSGQGKSNQRDTRDNYNRDNYNRDNNNSDSQPGVYPTGKPKRAKGLTRHSQKTTK
jgi:hypothetical protein